VPAAPAPPPPDGADGRLTQLGTGPLMMPPAPTEPLRELPLNASTIVSPAGMLPLILTETVTPGCDYRPVAWAISGESWPGRARVRVRRQAAQVRPVP
jgi:hypothetical protein